MNASLHVLCALLDYQPVPLDPADPQSARPNLFVSLLAQIDQPADYEFMFKGLTKLLGNPIYATSTYLPNSTKSVSCQQELLIFFWQLIQSNKVLYYHIWSFYFLKVLTKINLLVFRNSWLAFCFVMTLWISYTLFYIICMRPVRTRHSLASYT
jgi:hypothetical protein